MRTAVAPSRRNGCWNCFDACTLLADEHGRLSDNVSRDELHLKEVGYARLNDALANLLESL